MHRAVKTLLAIATMAAIAGPAGAAAPARDPGTVAQQARPLEAMGSSQQPPTLDIARCEADVREDPFRLSGAVCGPGVQLAAFGDGFPRDEAAGAGARRSPATASESSRPGPQAARQGKLDATVATVPEPQTYALMLAGLAMMIVLARRRRRDTL